MEGCKEIVNCFIQKGMEVEKSVSIAGFSRSVYYYRSNGRKQGKPPSQTTIKNTGEIVDNSVVIRNIKEIISPDFIDYGYDKVAAQLCEQGYIINRKKVYRLMKENRLFYFFSRVDYFGAFSSV